MFTGIISHIGKFIRKKNQLFVFEADASVCKKLVLGTSIAVNGVCLTVCKLPVGNSFLVTVMPETIRKTMLGSMNEGDLVNLELPVTPNDFLSGHIVQGHVDGVGIVSDIVNEGDNKLLKIDISPELNKYIVRKGSITINGISLTVIGVEDKYFTVGIIPHTWTHTMLQKIKIGDKVNLETDIIAKYIERLLQIN